MTISPLLLGFVLLALALAGDAQQQRRADDVDDDEHAVGQRVVPAGLAQQHGHDEEGELLQQGGDGRRGCWRR